MAESSGRYIDNEFWRAPAANSYKLLYTVSSGVRTGLAVHVCNAMGADAHISLYVIPMTDASGWAEGSSTEPPAYTMVYGRVRVESSLEPDGLGGTLIDGTQWDSTVLWLNPQDRLIGMTTLAGVTFYPHGVGEDA